MFCLTCFYALQSAGLCKNGVDPCTIIARILAIKTSSPPPGLEPGSSDCRSGALPLSYRVRQVFTIMLRLYSERVATIYLLSTMYGKP